MNEEALQTLADSHSYPGDHAADIGTRNWPNPGLLRSSLVKRRWRAAQIAGLTEVPVLVREIADEAALAMALIENIQREKPSTRWKRPWGNQAPD